MKSKALIVSRVKAADVYKDIVRIDVETRGQEYEESRIYKLTCGGRTHLISVRGMADEKVRSPNHISMDEKTRGKFKVKLGETYAFTLHKPICPLLALVCWSAGSSDPLQRMAAYWGLFSILGLLLALPGLFGMTLPSFISALTEPVVQMLSNLSTASITSPPS